jgi:hypothetical protein
MKIGILITRLKAEKKKDELLNINSRKRPWLKNTPKSLTIKSKGKIYTMGDVSIGMYIIYKYSVEVDFISPEDISTKRLHSNDINFMIIYDLLEAYHVDYKKNGNKKLFDNFKRTLQNVRNIYPPYSYQKFINNKCSYIKFLGKLHTNVIPTYCITTQKFIKEGMVNTINILHNKIKQKKWLKFIGKPIYGQESIDFKVFELDKNGNFDRNLMKKYMINGFKKYPGLIFQEYIPGFDKNVPEVRMYYIGEKYKYSVVTTNDSVKLLRNEGGTADIKNLKKLKDKGYDIINKLPKIKIGGKILPQLLTRTDIGVLSDDKHFVNEVEFVPSLYIEDIKIIPEPMIGDQMFKILTIFKS